MIKNLIFDLSSTLLFRKSYPSATVNDYHDKVSLLEGFKFFDHFFIYTETFNILRKLKSSKKMFILTSGDIQEDPAIRPLLDDIFSKIYSAEVVGLSKSDPSIYRHVLSVEDIEPHETLFVDDLERNIQSAEIIGLRTHRYTNENELRILLNQLLTEDTI